jgi:SNF2-related domain/Helicase conserved C-terminal domain/SprT-like family
MDRAEFSKWARAELNNNGLQKWGLRINSSLNPSFPYLGLCSYKDQCIIISSHHLQIHPDEEIKNTVRHEIAHALTPGHAHDTVWQDKAKEVGCTSAQPCSHLSFPPHVIDAIRSGADIEVTIDIETIHKPRYTVTRLQDKCEVCGKVAKTKNELLLENKDPFKPDEKFIYLECGHLLIKKIPKGTPFQTLTTKDDCKPYPFQVEGMKFIEQALVINKGAAVFDEMGLGKTIQALGYLRFHSEAFPVLFVVKSATKFQWFKEILKWLGDDHLCQMINKSDDWLIPNLKGYIISYDIMVSKQRTNKKTGKVITQGFDISKFAKIGIKTIILDECQQIKNPDSARTQEVRRLVKNAQVIALSGTPWKNRGSEFFTILNMLAPMKFPTYQGFLDRWVDFYQLGTRTKEGGIRRPQQFKEYIKDIAIRREIKDVAVQMPDVTRNLLFCELDQVEQNEYDESVSEFVKWYNEKVIGGEEDSGMVGQNILAKMARMRHITGLAKIPATVMFAKEFIKETDRKLCIFVHHEDVGQLMVEELRKKLKSKDDDDNGVVDVPVYALTSDLSSQRRFELQELFNKTQQCVLVASTLASGEGLNLQTCSDAILHERQWNPANEDQAAPGRFRRIGAAALELGINIGVTFTTASGTIDEHLGQIVEEKRKNWHAAMNKGEMPVWNQTSLAKELAESIVNDFNRKKKSNINSFTKIDDKKAG